MANKNITFTEIKDSYDEFIDSCAKFNSFTRSEKIQEKKYTECQEQIQVIKGYKQQAIQKEDEHIANQFFHFQCMLNSMASSLKLWIELKEEKHHSAWCNLIDAQEYIEIALKITDYDGIRNMEYQLDCIEHAVFPGWSLYNSPGHTETIGKCSICKTDFIHCDHIENKIYMGQLCQRVDRKIIEANHTAMVKNPYDRRCIMTKVTGDNNKMIDYFTWEETDDLMEKDGQYYVEGVLFSFHSLDVN
jgi:hypothetical protein